MKALYIALFITTAHSPIFANEISQEIGEDCTQLKPKTYLALANQKDKKIFYQTLVKNKITRQLANQAAAEIYWQYAGLNQWRVTNVSPY